MKYLTVHYPLIGQEAEYDDAAKVYSGNWAWPDDALTASTKKLFWNWPQPDVQYARISVVWWPITNGQLRVVVCDDGPSNIQNFGQWFGPLTSAAPITAAQDVTYYWNYWAANSPSGKHLGYQCAGNVRVGKCEIEVAYKIPDDQSAEILDLQTRVAALENPTP